MTKGAFFAKHTKLTRSLKKFVLDYQVKLERGVFEAFLESLSAELAAVTADLSQYPAGPLRARRLHGLVEKEIAAETEIQVSCKKGCSACCHMEVEITTYEAEILKQLISSGFVIDKDRLKQQGARTLQDPQWRAGMNEANRCVFLDTAGACGIYEDRPVMCRRHSVTSPAENCVTSDGDIVVRYFPRVDLLISAANEDPDLRIGPLAKMLAKEM